MSYRIESFNASDHTAITCYLWDGAVRPVGIVQIIHGMAEHAARYDRFARALSAHGFIVFADDHRGHGRTAAGGATAGAGYGKDVFADILRDEIEISEHLKERFGLPLAVFGHGCGGVIAQRYIRLFQGWDALILSGVSRRSRFLLYSAWLLSAVTRLFKGRRGKAKLVDRMVFGKDKKLKSVMLTRDPDEAKRYFDDPLCGAVPSAAFYMSFFRHAAGLYGKRSRDAVDRGKPVHFIGGTRDKYCGETKHTERLFETYRALNMTNLSKKYYDGARRDLLNETNGEEVTEDIIKYLERVLLPVPASI
jgi:alpha-beta hydrolase superfamily lysophospholipase